VSRAANSLLVRGQDTDVLAVGQVVAAIGPAGTVAAPPGTDVLDAGGLRVAPGLVDIQVNGAAGVDITADPTRLWEVAAMLPRYGVTSFCPTVITSTPDIVEAALATHRAGPPAGIGPVARSLGLHLEGPMLAESRKGAHPAHRLRAPDPALYGGWSRDAGVAIVTLAPELPGAVDAVRALTGAGVTVAIGHTAASAVAVAAAVDAGATMVTHLFNAMPGLGHREPGPVGVALSDERLVAGLIVDGLHVAPDVVRLVWRLLGPDRLLLVSDAAAALGLPDGRTVLGEQPVVVEAGAVRLEDGTLAGSAAGLDACVRNLAAFAGCSFDQAVAAATAVPADLLGRRDVGRLRVGSSADLVVFGADGCAVATVAGGQVAWKS
jgi:N-acetylglucosamine-6-phosphate deacetylase